MYIQCPNKWVKFGVYCVRGKHCAPWKGQRPYARRAWIYIWHWAEERRAVGTKGTHRISSISTIYLLVSVFWCYIRHEWMFVSKVVTECTVLPIVYTHPSGLLPATLRPLGTWLVHSQLLQLNSFRIGRRTKYIYEKKLYKCILYHVVCMLHVQYTYR